MRLGKSRFNFGKPKVKTGCKCPQSNTQIKAASLYKKDFIGRIKTGNLTDDIEKIGDADKIIEVVVERLDIKKQVFEKVEQFRKSRSII